jgi:hypothetical protein
VTVALGTGFADEVVPRGVAAVTADDPVNRRGLDSEWMHDASRIGSPFAIAYAEYRVFSGPSPSRYITGRF